MADESGSRWYFPIFEGLFDAKHVEQMGPAVWLYGWILSRAHVAGKGGMIAYSHTDPVRDLGVCEKTVRLWFDRLQQCGYLITRARHSHSLDVAVTNWHSVEGWIKAKAEAGPVNIYQPPAERSADSYHSGVEDGKVIGKVIGKDLPSHITIRLLDYQYPEFPSGVPDGSEAPDVRPNLADAFHGLLGMLQTASNKAAVLRHIYGLCFPGELPDYAYLGKVARTVGGAGRLAEIMWGLTPKPPTGDVLAYILAMHKRASPSGGSQTRAEALRERNLAVIATMFGGGNGNEGDNRENARTVDGQLAEPRDHAHNRPALPGGAG